MTPIGVLHARVVAGAGGGPEKTILLSAAAAADSPYAVAAAYMHPPGDPGFALLRQRAHAAGARLIGVPDRGMLDMSVPGSLLGLCRRLQVRIWHGHDYKSNLIGLLLRPWHAMRLVTTVHGWVTVSRRTRLFYAVDRWCLPHYDHVICVSDDLAERVHELGVPEQRTTLLRNGVDIQAFRRRGPPASADLRRHLGVPPDRLVIGAIGRLSPEKDFETLIHAVGRLIGEGVNCELWIAGAGPQHEALRRLIGKLGLASRIRLLGFVQHPLELYGAFDCFVLSSVREGLPNVLLEAMAMEVAVVSTRLPGVIPLVEDGQTGLLARVADVDGLAAAMRRLLTDVSLRARLALAGHQRVEHHFQFSERLANERALYDSLLSDERPAVARDASAPRGG